MMRAADRDERAPLLPAVQPAGRHAQWWRSNLMRLALVAVIALCGVTSLALLRVSTLSTELLARLAHDQPPVAPSALFSAAHRLTGVSSVSGCADTSWLGAGEGGGGDDGGGETRGARVLVVYSEGVHLSQLARAVEQGVERAMAEGKTTQGHSHGRGHGHDAEAGSLPVLRTRTLPEASFVNDVLWADAIILGSHVVNANVEPSMAAFLSSWDFSQDLSHKVGAVFVTGGGLSAGEELTMVNLLHSLLIFRLVIVGGERWTSAFGASAVVSEGPFQWQSGGGSRRDDGDEHDTGASPWASDCYPSSPEEVHAMFKDKAVGLGHRVTSLATLLVRANPTR